MKPIFIKLSNQDEVIYININQITAIKPGAKVTAVNLQNDKVFNVDQSFEEIKVLIEQAQ